jgi:hypothetical protein
MKLIRVDDGPPPLEIPEGDYLRKVKPLEKMVGKPGYSTARDRLIGILRNEQATKEAEKAAPIVFNQAMPNATPQEVVLPEPTAATLAKFESLKTIIERTVPIGAQEDSSRKVLRQLLLDQESA